jgi:hypothetical protein
MWVGDLWQHHVINLCFFMFDKKAFEENSKRAIGLDKLQRRAQGTSASLHARWPSGGSESSKILSEV